MRRWWTLVLGSALLAGCGLIARPVTAPEAGMQAQATSEPEARVDQAQLEAVMAILTGKQPVPGLNATIAERGGVEGRKLTRDYLDRTLVAQGYQVKRHVYRDGGENVYATLAAASSGAPSVLVGAHLDSVRNAGADDNGSGTAVVLEVARVLRDLPGRKVNVILAFFDEEERGLVGSKYLARELKKQGVKLESVHTLDMVGYDKDNDHAVEIEQPDGNLWDYYQQVNRTHQLKLPLSRTNSGSTDHEAFRAEGFASVGLCEEWVGGDTTPHYHKKTDTYETLNFSYLADVARLSAATMADLARAVPGPARWQKLPHTMFPGRDREFIQY